ncbi:MAG: insulinase family protein [Deltaproteobacteria bacterium]|nr:insulinase family protein [Deltaproteobacteria bacterium]
MKLLVEPSRELPILQVVATFRVGGAHDPSGLEGLARVTARMLRRGTTRRTGDELEERFDALGAEFAANVGLSATSVGVETVVRSSEEAIALAAEVLAEPAFDEVELEKLKRQIEAEIVASRDEDDALASRALRRHLFAGHLHGRRVQGSVASVRAITREDVVAHYRRAFCRANVVVAIGGDVEASDAERIAEKLLAGLPEGERVSYPAPEPTLPKGRRLVIVEKPERSQCQLGVGTLGTRLSDDDHAALVLANTVFGGMFTSRLTQEIRVKRGWSYGASSGLMSGHVREAFTIWSAPSIDDAAACLGVELELLERLVEDGLTDDELRFAREYLRRSYAFEIDTAKKRLQQRLDCELFCLPEDFHRRTLERIGTVDAGEASAAVRRRLDPGALWVAVVASDGKLVEDLRATTRWDAIQVEPFDRD